MLKNYSFSVLPRKFKNLIFHTLTPLLGFCFPGQAVLAGMQLQRSQEGYPASSRGEGVGGDKAKAG